MHQKVDFAVLDKEKEHHIYTSMYIWFSRKLKTKTKERENILNEAFLFSVAVVRLHTLELKKFN